MSGYVISDCRYTADRTIRNCDRNMARGGYDPLPGLFVREGKQNQYG